MIEWNRSNIKKILGIITFTLLLYTGLNNFLEVLKGLHVGMRLLSPFLLGGCIAFIMNVPMRFIENKLMKSWKTKQQVKRGTSLIVTIIFFIILFFLVTVLVLPELGSTIGDLFVSIPDSLKNFQEWLLSKDIPWPEIKTYIENWNMDWNSIITKGLTFLKSGLLGSFFTTVGVVSSIVSGVTNFIIGFVFAIYILLQKEILSKQIRKVCYAFLPAKQADNIFYIAHLTEKVFSNYLTGQCLEAFILGMMFFVTMTIFQFPFALLVGVLIAVTALIPIVGAFIGCAVAIFLILTVSPVKVIWFIVLFNVLQQFEGNVIYPKVVGNSVGLPAIWVLAAVTLGGSTMGVLGMILYIPIFSVLYTLLRDKVNKKLNIKKIPREKWDL